MPVEDLHIAGANRSRWAGGAACAPFELEALEPRVLLSASPAAWTRLGIVMASPALDGNSPSSSAITPSEMRSAYGINEVLFGAVQGNGSGETVAVIDAYNYPTALDDLNAFSAQYGLPQMNQTGGPTFERVNQNGDQSGYPSTDPNGPAGTTGKSTWEMEESLDIEWVHAIAPQANIILVEAINPNYLFAAISWARNDSDAVAVSMSWGSSQPMSGEDSDFTTPSGHAGITFVAATGDDGAPGNYPAFSSNVVAVGGTSLYLNGSAYSSESGWSDSGGGISTDEPVPSWQSGLVVSGVSSVSGRAAPDISMDADPGTGVAIYDSWDYPSSPWLEVGGTSLSTPMFAAVMAIVDQGRAVIGLGSLDGATQTLPALYSLAANPTSYAADFHDITTGNNGYAAGPGYDLVTGLGSPVGNSLIYDLADWSTISGKVFQDNNANGVLDAGETGIAGASVYLDANNNDTLETSTPVTLSASGLNVSISTVYPTCVTSNLTVNNAGALVTGLTLTLNVTDSNDSKLTGYLFAPNGQYIELFAGTLAGANLVNTTFSDSASTGISSGSAAYTGTFTPVQALSTFDGLWANGTWTLALAKTSRNATTGTLTSWSLTVTTADDSTTTAGDGSYTLHVPPGTYTVAQVAPTGYVATVPEATVSVAAQGLMPTSFGDFPTVFTAAGAAESYYVRADSAPGYVDISHAAAPLSPPTYVAPLSLLPSLTFDLTGGGENLYVDYSSGSPMPSGGLSLAATGTGDGLTVVGSGLSQSVTLGSSQVSLAGGGAAVTWTGLSSLSLQDCTATFSGTISPPALSVNAGAALSGSGTLIAAVTLVGGALSGPMTIQGNLTSTGGSISPAAGTARRARSLSSAT